MSGKLGKGKEMKTTIELVFEEYDRAVNKFGSFASAHEGKAIIEEELDELWDEIKAGQNKNRMKEEALQVAAMAIRFVQDICDK